MRFALLTMLLASSAPALAESPQEFAKRIEQPKAVNPVINQRDDGSFGSLSIGIQPAVVEDRGKLDLLLAEIGKYAAESKFKADVLAPTQADADYLVSKLNAAGVTKVGTRIMAPTVSIKTTRVFLTPDRPVEKKPAPSPAPDAGTAAAPAQAEPTKTAPTAPKKAAPQPAK
jgi:hypothetical protein